MTTDTSTTEVTESTEKQAKPKPAAQTFSASDLAKALNVQPKAVRQALRALAKTDSSPLLRVRDEGGYSWSKRELESVAKKLGASSSKSTEGAASE